MYKQATFKGSEHIFFVQSLMQNNTILDLYVHGKELLIAFDLFL